MKPVVNNMPATKHSGGQQSLAASFAKGTVYARGSKKWHLPQLTCDSLYSQDDTSFIHR